MSINFRILLVNAEKYYLTDERSDKNVQRKGTEQKTITYNRPYNRRDTHYNIDDGKREGD